MDISASTGNSACFVCRPLCTLQELQHKGLPGNHWVTCPRVLSAHLTAQIGLGWTGYVWGNLQNCLKSPPGELLGNTQLKGWLFSQSISYGFVQYLKPNQTPNPLSHLCTQEAAQSLEQPGNSWLKCKNRNDPDTAAPQLWLKKKFYFHSSNHLLLKSQRSWIQKMLLSHHIF